MKSTSKIAKGLFWTLLSVPLILTFAQNIHAQESDVQPSPGLMGWWAGDDNRFWFCLGGGGRAITLFTVN